MTAERGSNSIINDMSLKVAELDERATSAELRVIDLEARSRRNNLVFHGLPEPSRHENEHELTERLYFLFGQQMGMLDPQIMQVRFQRIHRLGPPRIARRGHPPPKPRPIIACFTDYPMRQDVLTRAKMLKGTQFTISEDFPAEIRDARGELWEDYRNARRENLRPKLVYPAKLVINKEVVKNKFPQWGSWMKSKTSRRQPADFRPRSGTPMEVPLEALIQSAPVRRPSTGGGASSLRADAPPFTSSGDLPNPQNIANQTIEPVSSQQRTSGVVSHIPGPELTLPQLRTPDALTHPQHPDSIATPINIQIERSRSAGASPVESFVQVSRFGLAHLGESISSALNSLQGNTI